MIMTKITMSRTSFGLSGMDRWTLRLRLNRGVRATSPRKGDDCDFPDDLYEVRRDDDEEMAWQHHINKCTEDQLMEDIARTAVEEAKARANANEAEVREFIKVKKKGK